MISPRAVAGLDTTEDDGASVALLEEQVAAQYDVAGHTGIEGHRVLVRSHKFEVVVLHGPEIGRHRNADDRIGGAT